MSGDLFQMQLFFIFWVKILGGVLTLSDNYIFIKIKSFDNLI